MLSSLYVIAASKATAVCRSDMHSPVSGQICSDFCLIFFFLHSISFVRCSSQSNVDPITCEKCMRTTHFQIFEAFITPTNKQHTSLQCLLIMILVSNWGQYAIDVKLCERQWCFFSTHHFAATVIHYKMNESLENDCSNSNLKSKAKTKTKLNSVGVE